MCSFCHHHPPWARAVAIPMSLLPRSYHDAPPPSYPLRKGTRISVCFMAIEEFSESGDLWHSSEMFIYCISTQQSKTKTNHKEQFKDIPRRTGNGTLMVIFLQLLVPCFQRQTAKVITEIPWIGPAAFLKAMAQDNVMESQSSFHSTE